MSTDLTRQFTAAAYSLGYAVDLTAKPSADPFGGTVYRCTWRRSGPLGSGEYRELTVSEAAECLHPEHIFDGVVIRRLVKPLIGAEILDRIWTAFEHLRNGADVPARVEFYGGPKDGDVWTVRADHDGYPALDYLRVALPVAGVWASQTSPDPTAPALPVAVYRRGNLDPERGVWRYDYSDSTGGLR